MKDADWIIHSDIDEFLNIHVGDGRIADLIAALPDVDAIALTSDNPSREFYKLQLARRDMLRHLRTLLGRAQARPGPLLTKLVCQHTYAYIQPPPNLSQHCSRWNKRRQNNSVKLD